MIAQYEDAGRSPLLDAPRQYGLTQQHKHLKEMQAVCGLTKAPIFCPIVSDFYSGMAVTVPLFAGMLKPGYTVKDIREVYRALYAGPWYATRKSSTRTVSSQQTPLWALIPCRFPLWATRSGFSWSPGLTISAKARPAPR